MTTNDKIEKLIASSACFGVAYDISAKECRICEVKQRCKAKQALNISSGDVSGEKLTLDAGADALQIKEHIHKKQEENMKKGKTKEENTALEDEKSTKVKSPKAKKEKVQANYSKDMPVFKEMETGELSKLLKKRGGDPKECEKYTNDTIKRMQLIMRLKKTYEVK